jgi:hypothetical protein
METVSDSTSGKQWPGNVPAEADAVKMLLGELPPGEFQSVVDSFRASLGPVEKGVLDLRSNQTLITAMAVKWRLTAAIAVAPLKLSEVDTAAVDALVQETQDAVLGLTSGVASVTDFNIKQVYEGTKRSLNFLSGKLKQAVPKEAAPPPPAPVAAPEAPVAAPAAPAPAPEAPPPPPPPVAAPPAAVAAAASAGVPRWMVFALVILAVVAAAVNGMNYMRDQADLKARREKEAKLPTSFKNGKLEQITLLTPSPEKVAELEARAKAEGKRLIKISSTEFQLVEDGSAPAPTPAPEAPRPDAPAPDAPKPEGAAPDAPAPAPKDGEGAKP